MPHASPGQTLLLDADDTLLENNVCFERAIADYTLMAHDLRQGNISFARRVLADILVL